VENAMNDMRGHNAPPSPIEAAADSLADLAVYLQENPVIVSEDDARLAKTFIDRSKASLEELEINRKREVQPLNFQVSNINSRYKAAYHPLERMLDVLKDRLTTYIRAEEERREQATRAAHELAVKAEQAAREAEAREQEALANAAVGEAVDVGAAVVAADISFGTYAKAARALALAERSEHVKIDGGFKNAVSLRRKEKLILDDGIACLEAMGWPENVEEAIIVAARAYRKEFGKLPPGIRSVEEQKL
jgi:hypothetical protein